MVLICRDPFARIELHREQVTPHGQTCAWCGGLNARRKLFLYRVEHDGGRKETSKWAFCSIGCYRSFNT